MKLFKITAAALYAMSIVAASSENVIDFATLAGDNPVQAFEKLIASPKPVIIKFTRPGCPPCAASEPGYQKMAQDFKGKAIFVSLRTDLFSNIANQLKIRGVPTWMLFANKTKLAQITGSPKLPQIGEALTDYLTKQTNN